ncbi:FAD-binding protein [Embleya sp. NPDC020886]|uniref:FAD-binding protein n=1 Tax=Embleya sp. NPDC020886 TaxID=3363980 RepID=UPI0037B014AF
MRHIPLLVVGGGIGGMTAGLALARAGFDAHIVEQAPEFAEIGAGIQLAPQRPAGPGRPRRTDPRAPGRGAPAQPGPAAGQTPVFRTRVTPRTQSACTIIEPIPSRRTSKRSASVPAATMNNNAGRVPTNSTTARVAGEEACNTWMNRLICITQVDPADRALAIHSMETLRPAGRDGGTRAPESR